QSASSVSLGARSVSSRSGACTVNSSDGGGALRDTPNTLAMSTLTSAVVSFVDLNRYKCRLAPSKACIVRQPRKNVGPLSLRFSSTPPHDALCRTSAYDMLNKRK